MTEALTVRPEGQITAANRSIFNSSPKAMVEEATQIASVLADVLRKQGLCSNIQGKDYVKVEGWATLGSMLGILPREKEVKELKPGVWEASVELVNARSGMVVGCGSAICTRAEKRWARAEDYAVRSMAITRATGKAYRLGLGWVMAMAGFSPTPQEEMPEESGDAGKQEVVSPPAASRAASKPHSKPNGQASGKAAAQPVVQVFDQTNAEHLAQLLVQLEAMQVPEDLHDGIAVELNGKEFRKSVIQQLVAAGTVLEGVFEPTGG